MDYRTRERLYPFAAILDTAVSGFITRNFDSDECENQKKFEAHLKPVYQFVKDPFGFWKHYKTLYFMQSLNENEFCLIKNAAHEYSEEMIDILIQKSLVKAATLTLATYKEIHEFEVKQKTVTLSDDFLRKNQVEEKAPCPKPKIPKEIKELLHNK